MDPKLQIEQPIALLAEALFLTHEWQKRKVESIRLLDEAHGLVKVSIDCVVSPLNGLRFNPGSNELGSGDYVIVPVTLIEKGPLRQFDMRGHDGSPLVVLGREDYLPLVRDLLLYEVSEALSESTVDDARGLIDVVIDGDRENAERASESLMQAPAHGETPLLRPDALSDWARTLLTRLPNSYILFALVPVAWAGKRVVLKYAHQWTGDAGGFRWWQRVSGAFGYSDLELEVVLGNPSGSASYHLEVVLPDGVEGHLLTMPGHDRPDSRDRNTSDSMSTSVLHGVVRMAESDQPASAWVTVGAERAQQLLTLMVLCVTAAILALGSWLPNAQQALLVAKDGAAALLIAMPAVVLAFLVRRRENQVATLVLQPLRAVIIGCALLLFCCAASIVGYLWDAPRLVLWQGGASVAILAFVALAVGLSIEASRCRGRVGGSGDHPRRR